MGFSYFVLFLGINALLLWSLYDFGRGFFPYKPYIQGYARYDEFKIGEPAPAPFNKLVFMVVDALRSDFLFSNESGFSFAQNLISTGGAIPFTAHATPPTVTMPRLKAILTGSVPSYLDGILNLAESDTSSSLQGHDTWVQQMSQKATGNQVMFGDDTWLKLFPLSFDERSDGTTSFFVADFTEVDNNVTRHVPEELGRDDWNTMILHYLGLDHIGHSSGPKSPNMIPKQREMDGIVQQIYTALETLPHLDSTLLVLCGDHGMNDKGDHGGAGVGETSAGLLFVSPKFKQNFPGIESPLPIQSDYRYYGHIQQSDIAPTLGGLLGFPSPVNNLGNFISDFLRLWPDDKHKLQLLYRNARQIFTIVEAQFPAESSQYQYSKDCSNMTHGGRLVCDWHQISRKIDLLTDLRNQTVENLLDDLLLWSRDAQNIMSRMASNYDMNRLRRGIFETVLAVVGTMAVGCFKASPLVSTSAIVIMLTYGLMMFTSSYVEEEHQFWYWASSGWLLFLVLKTLHHKGVPSSFSKSSLHIVTKAVAALVVLRVARRWNQTGQKFAGAPDITSEILHEHTTLLWLMITVTLMYTAFCNFAWTKTSRSWRVGAVLAVVQVSSFLSFKLYFSLKSEPLIVPPLGKILLDRVFPWVDLERRAQFIWKTIGSSFVLIAALEIWIRKQHVQNRPRFSNLQIAAENLRLSTIMDAMHALIVWVLIMHRNLQTFHCSLGSALC